MNHLFHVRLGISLLLRVCHGSIGSTVVHSLNLAGLVRDDVFPREEMLGFLVLLNKVAAAAAPCLEQKLDPS